MKKKLERYKEMNIKKTPEEWVEYGTHKDSDLLSAFEMAITQGRREGAEAMAKYIPYVRCDSSAPIPTPNDILAELEKNSVG